MDKIQEIIDSIRIIRDKMNKELIAIENAKFRMDHESDINTDKTWELVYRKQNAAYAKSYAMFQSLMQAFFNLKSTVSDEEWKTALENFGYTLAVTENVPHVVENMFDERDLIQALNKTSDIIVSLNKKLRSSLESRNGDQSIIIASQLKFYENDMLQHHWGESRLMRIHLEDDIYAKYLEANAPKITFEEPTVKF